MVSWFPTRASPAVGLPLLDFLIGADCSLWLLVGSQLQRAMAVHGVLDPLLPGMAYVLLFIS